MPAAGVPLNTPVAGTKVTPVGRLPDMERLGAGEPLAVTVKVPAALTVKLVLLALVMAGASLIVMLKSCVALGNMPLVAVTVPVKVPRVVGVPERTPADVNVSPVGNEPDVTEKVIGAEPVVV